MTALPACPTFAEFYFELFGREPLRWQVRLADQVVERDWPEEIGVPTGLGKTTTLDIAVWALAYEADLSADERTKPTRIWYVVDRRLLVDEASRHAEELADLLVRRREDEPASAIGRVAVRLAHVGGGLGQPLHVSSLRGGAQLGVRPVTPAQPAIICATVAMYGSRLLFRGFGSSSRMWPIDAALAGTDALLIVDEAHLAAPLLALIDKAGQCDGPNANILRNPLLARHEADHVLPADRMRPQVTALTATGRASNPFTLVDADLEEEIVIQRLDAAKPTELVEGTARAMPKDLAQHAIRLLDQAAPHGAAAVFVNSPATARQVAQALAGDGRQVVVVTGQLRAREADKVRAQLLDEKAGCRSGATPDRARPLFVVATQTLEVGADLDFDVCVSEMAGVRALTQRWGRLNRLGGKPHARGLLYWVPGTSDEGLYRSEPRQLWTKLSALDGEVVDLRPRTIHEHLSVPDPDELDDYVAELLPNHLWELAKTSDPSVDAAPPEVFFAGIDDDQRRVSVLWRSGVGELLPGAARDKTGDADEPDSAEPEQAVLFPAPSSTEFLDLPIGAARELLARIDRGRFGRLTVDGGAIQVFDTDALRVGDRVVLDVDDGGYLSREPFGFDPLSKSVVLDVSPFERSALFLTPKALANLLLDSTADADSRAHLVDEDDVPVDLSSEEWFGLSAEAKSDPDLIDFSDDDARAGRFARLLTDQHPEVAAKLWPESGFEGRELRVERVGPDGLVPLLVWKADRGGGRDVRVDALDELSLADPLLVDASLVGHLEGVGAIAEYIGQAVGLDERSLAAVREAGRWHDLGKAHWQFQAWLGAEPGALMAKSDVDPNEWERNRVASGWPRGGRHELLSVQLVDAALEAGLACADPDLVRHLVISHHGHGRPLVPTAGTDAPAVTRVTVGDVTFEAKTSPSVPDWDQPDRFLGLSRRFGYWGLALLEAVVRQADHLASASTTSSIAADGVAPDSESTLEVQ